MPHKAPHAAGGQALVPAGAAKPVQPGWAYVIALVVLTGAAAALRAGRLDHPMRYDESYTFLRFVVGPGPPTWLDYEAPNNHLLHTLAVVAWTRAAGLAPWAVRLPAFLAGVALVPAAGELARRLSGKRTAGLIAAALVAGSSLLIEYSVNSRGYSLVCLMSLLMAICTVAVFRDVRSTRAWVGWAAAAAVGMWTIPIMLYPIGIFTVLILLQVCIARPGWAATKAVLARLALALSAAAAATLLFYLPSMLISGPRAVVANRFVSPLPLPEVLGGLGGAAGEAIGHWLRDASWLWAGLMMVGLVACIAAGLRRRNVAFVLPALAPLLLWAAAVAHRVVPFPRVWLFCLPLGLAWAAVGLAVGLFALPGRRARMPAGAALAVLVAIAVGGSAWRAWQRPYLISEDPNTMVDAERIVLDAVGLADGRTALLWDWNAPTWPPLGYYVMLHGDAAAGLIDYRDPQCSRAVLATGRGRQPQEVLSANPGSAERFGAVLPLKHYPGGAETYLAVPAQPAGGKQSPLRTFVFDSRRGAGENYGQL